MGALESPVSIESTDDAAAHGIVIVDYRTAAAPDRIILHYNTDTVMAAWYGIQAVGLEWGAHLKGEYAIAGLLTDYYRRSTLVEEAGLQASFAEVAAYTKKELWPRQYTDVSLALRRWVFERGDFTAADFKLPANQNHLQMTLRHSLWHLQQDAGWEDAWRLFPRLHGWAVIGTLSSLWRNDQASWGPVWEAAQRNDPAPRSDRVELWIGGGGDWAGGLLQGELRAFSSQGSDDLDRTRVGGMSPYVVPAYGLPWAALMADDGAGLNASYAVRWHDHLFGPALQLVTVNDPERTGDQKAWGNIPALGFYGDMRWQSYQLDLRIGRAFPPWWRQVRAQVGLYLGVGREF
jgi:hypothetical protein